MKAFLLTLLFRLKYGPDYTLHDLSVKEQSWADGLEDQLG